jgi:FAD/FMN-containing dehydrogenase
LARLRGIIMRRRTLCWGGLAALAGAALPGRRHLAAEEAGAAPAADLDALGLDGRQLTLKGGTLAELRAALRGELLSAGQPGYDGARRLWNPAFDHRPALIARCAGAADVRQAVSFAAANGLLTAVRAGGHSFSGQSGCDGGLVIDVSPLRAVEVDPLARLARVESGALLGDFDRETQAFGLACTAGVAADTGIAGLTLGGGIGRLGRKFGLSCDNLAAAELVTADGRWLRASEHENPELLWGLRGGGGNFGVVTSFTFRLHELGPQVFGGTLSFPFTDARALLRRLAEAIAAAPDELYVGPDLEPGEHGDLQLDLDVCYCGPLQDAQAALAPLRRIGKPLHDDLAAQPYTRLQGSEQMPGVARASLYLKGGLIDSLTPALIDTTVGFLESNPAQHVGIGFQPVGGAIARVAPGASAYWNRGASHNLFVWSYWKAAGDAEPQRDWVRRAWTQLEPLTHGSYVNIIGSGQHENRAQAAYGDNYPRLAALKKRYDPNNLFRLNPNIRPA